MLRRRRPRLLAVYDIRVTCAFGTGTQRRQIRTGLWFRKTLTPPVVQIGCARQEAPLLLFVAELRNNRSNHAGVERERRGYAGLLHFILIEVELHRAPLLAAPRGRPVRHRPTPRVQDSLRGYCIVFAEMFPLLHL